jgi:hypothetical protein
MKDLTNGCNGVTDYFRKVFGEIDATISSVDTDSADTARMKTALLSIKKSLTQVRLE